jgi:diguanylate cyclase (GGDEF)-like protein
MVLPETGPEGALCVAEQIHAAVHRLQIPNPGSPVSDRVTVTQGVATAWPARKGLSNELMAAVDRALYEAKQAGRDRICTASPAASATDAARID